eukprot:Filipodium_phascolosomae@DN5639_c0_g1_i1.p1
MSAQVVCQFRIPFELDGGRDRFRRQCRRRQSLRLRQCRRQCLRRIGAVGDCIEERREAVAAKVETTQAETDEETERSVKASPPPPPAAAAPAAKDPLPPPLWSLDMEQWEKKAASMRQTRCPSSNSVPRKYVYYYRGSSSEAAGVDCSVQKQ